jgi:hypothetical protein
MLVSISNHWRSKCQTQKFPLAPLLHENPAIRGATGRRHEARNADFCHRRQPVGRTGLLGPEKETFIK